MNPIYHLAPAERWRAWPENEPYLPAEYAADGFVHCTQGDALMVQVANRFYHATPGEFLLLVIDPERLTSPLIWEVSDDLAPEFPHIYGPINRNAIIGERMLQRNSTGEFTGIA